MKEKETGIYPIKVLLIKVLKKLRNPQDTEISAEEFQEMLDVIQPMCQPISIENYIFLLKLANRFEMPAVSQLLKIY